MGFKEGKMTVRVGHDGNRMGIKWKQKDGAGRAALTHPSGGRCSCGCCGGGRGSCSFSWGGTLHYVLLQGETVVILKWNGIKVRNAA